MPSLYCTGWSQWPLQHRLKTESADSHKFWVYLLRAKIGQRHSNDLIDLTIIEENIKIGNGKNDSVCRSVIEPDPAATTGVELVATARGRSGGRAGPVLDQELVQAGNSHFPLQAICLFVRGADTRAFCKKLSISGVHHSLRVDVRRSRRFLWRYFLFSPAQALGSIICSHLERYIR